MEQYYIVTELQVNKSTPAIISNVYADRGQALAKYYTILAAAAVSTIDMHGAFFASSDGGQYTYEMFDRREQAEE